MNNIFDTQDHTAEFDYGEIQSSNYIVMALTYIFPFLPYIVSPNSNYGKFHANQGLLCWIVGAVLSICSKIICSLLSLIPLLNLFLPSVISSLIGLVILAFFGLGIFNALNQRAKELPFIGHYVILKY